MYPNPFNSYQGISPAYHNQMNSNQIIKVNGRGGADAYQMPPNSQALLLDEMMEIVKALQPRLYDATINKLN